MTRIFSLLIFIIGILCVSWGIVVIAYNDPAELHRDTVEDSLKDVIPKSEIDEWYKNRGNKRIIFGVALLMYGLATVITSIGIWLKKNWARISWLIIITVLAIAYLPMSKTDLKIFTSDDWIHMIIILSIGICSWIYFYMRSTKALFMRRR